MRLRGLIRSKRARLLLLFLLNIIFLVILTSRGTLIFAGPGTWGSVRSNDFVEYWSAAQVLLGGGNPYDPDAVFGVEQQLGWPRSELVLMWNPPWTLALSLPLALLPFELATYLWLILQFSLILGCGVLLWRYFAPGDRRYWIGLLLAAGFIPGLFSLRMLQISFLLLAGVVGFLFAERARRDTPAGAALALLLVKPQYAYLFWIAALWWAWRARRWRVLGGLLATLAAASGLVLVFRPGIFADYLVAATGPPLYWVTCTLGAWLRLIFGAQHGWLQFLPSLVGLLGLALWLWRRRGPWHWEQIAPPLLLASALTASYGWDYDQLVLLPVVVALVSQMRAASAGRRAVVLSLLAASQLALLVQNRFDMSAAFYVWHPWVLAGLYWWGVSGVQTGEGAHHSADVEMRAR